MTVGSAVGIYKGTQIYGNNSNTANKTNKTVIEQGETKQTSRIDNQTRLKKYLENEKTMQQDNTGNGGY